MMQLQRTTLWLVVLALLLGGLVLVLELRKPPITATTAAQQSLFSFQESQVQQVRLITPEGTVALERNASPTPESTQWQLQQPVQEPANDANVTYLLSLLATGRRDRTLTIAAKQLAEFGLQPPALTIEVQLADRRSHRLELGKADFSSQYLYARVDPTTPNDGEQPIALVSRSLQDAAQRPLSDWRQTRSSPTPTNTSTVNPPAMNTPAPAAASP